MGRETLGDVGLLDGSVWSLGWDVIATGWLSHRYAFEEAKQRKPQIIKQGVKGRICDALMGSRTCALKTLSNKTLVCRLLSDKTSLRHSPGRITGIDTKKRNRDHKEVDNEGGTKAKKM